MPTLVALFGPKRGVRLDLGGPVLIGRSSAAELQLIDGKVSREHCRLQIERHRGEDRVVLHDLGSQNGTFVNGERIRGNRALARGDEIAVGDSLFLLDPDLAVMAARFGDATLVVSSERAPGKPVTGRGTGAPTSAFRADVVPPTPDPNLDVVRALAATLTVADGVEAGASAVLAALASGLGPAQTFLLVGDGVAGDPRVLSARASDGQGGDRTPVVDRATLAAAAKRRRAIVVEGPVQERTHGDSRSISETRTRALLVAPIVAGNRVRGFLCLDRSGPGGFVDGEIALVETVAQLAALHGLGGALGSADGTAGAAVGGPVGQSAAFARVLKVAAAAGRATSTVLVTGETGTGKEEIARAIHRASGRGPFVAVNCGAIPEALAETELFGHEKGAFTGAVSAREGRIESADGGTLFLDEIGELAPALQVKLLRVLQERIFFRVGSTTPRSVDIRVIAATHRQVEAEVKAGRFREDLFYRLNVLRIEIPPLRDRREDIAPLATVLLARIAAGLGRPDPGLAGPAMLTLGRVPWPGNARQLGNVLERALVLREPGTRGPLGAGEILAALGSDGDGEGGTPAGDDTRGAVTAGVATSLPMSLPTSLPTSLARSLVTSLPDKVLALERTEIVAALRAARGVKARAAKLLGLSRPTLDKKITDLAIDMWPDEGRGPSR